MGPLGSEVGSSASAWRVWRSHRGLNAGTRRAAPWLVLLALSTLGCAPRARFDPGDECELNTGCTSPLVCRLNRCRNECRVTRDCDVGLACVLNRNGLGACLLPAETECQLSSDCPAFLVCRFGQCTNACSDDRDCPPGARCQEDDEGLGCRDTTMADCQLNSDCAAPLTCANDNRCREQCREDRDCRPEEVCLAGEPAVCGLPDAGVDGPSMDAGTTDAGTTDAGTTDAGTTDAGMTDAGTTDTGTTDAGTTDAGTTDAGEPLVEPPPAPLLAAGAGHSCAAPNPDDLRCWGANTDGQLGNGTSDPTAGVGTVPTVSAVTIVAAGSRHSCIVADAAVRCWGQNGFGQIGTGDTTSVSVPTTVTLPTTTTDLSCGSDHSCSISDARVFCWGNNERGQLGTGDTALRLVPQEVAGLSRIPVGISTFSRHTCVRLDDGTVACFGDNRYGQVGVDGEGSIVTPTLVAGLDRVVQIHAGTNHTCALREEGDVWCWGLNLSGQLGQPTSVTMSSSPLEVTALSAPVAELGLGAEHTCARMVSGDVRCFGANTFGQLGRDITTTSSPEPEAVPGISTALSVRAGSSHTCVWSGGTTFRCFGRNDEGQLDGTPGGLAVPTPTEVPWL